jgi:hypothetical protein
MSDFLLSVRDMVDDITRVMPHDILRVMLRCIGCLRHWPVDGMLRYRLDGLSFGTRVRNLQSPGRGLNIVATVTSHDRAQNRISLKPACK